ncbi:hypothetical protein BGX34_007355 [Mortierella sp. NVP85]|nr:hypothetical protein BGX34_007355 [Mortierella sp. NVP85]
MDPAQTSTYPNKPKGPIAGAQEAGLEQAPPGYSKLFVFSAIVVFLAFAFHSLPNVLSANNPRADAVRSGVVRHQGDSVVQSSGVALDHTLGSATDTPLDSSNFAKLDHTEPKLDIPENDSNIDERTRIHNTDHISPPQKAQGQGHAVPLEKASPSPLSEKKPQQQQQKLQQDQPQRTSLMGEIDIGLWIRAGISLGLQLVFWILQKIYQSVRFVIAKPIEVTAALVETPYVMTRDICKAFLPVYSFFSVAAVIGIVVGGSAIWVAQLIISAVGAEERPNQAVVLHNIPMPRHYRAVDVAVASGPKRTYSIKERENTVLARPVSLPEPNPIKPTVSPYTHTRPVNATPVVSKGRGPMIEDVDEDEDEDEDEDDDWDHV